MGDDLALKVESCNFIVKYQIINLFLNRHNLELKWISIFNNKHLEKKGTVNLMFKTCIKD